MSAMSLDSSPQPAGGASPEPPQPGADKAPRKKGDDKVHKEKKRNFLGMKK